MEVSPDDRRPAYSGYFNAFVAPAALLPLAGAGIIEATSLDGVFVAAPVVALIQYFVLRHVRLSSVTYIADGNEHDGNPSLAISRFSGKGHGRTACRNITSISWTVSGTRNEALFEPYDAGVVQAGRGQP